MAWTAEGDLLALAETSVQNLYYLFYGSTVSKSEIECLRVDCRIEYFCKRIGEPSLIE